LPFSDVAPKGNSPEAFRSGKFIPDESSPGFGLDIHRIEHYRQIVARFEAAARADLEKLVQVSRLARAAGVTLRTLERAVHAVHATTPLEFLRALRLSEARQTLSTCGSTTTVTEVATRFGFRELGRFAGEYRDRFGESPSDTLRRSARGGCEA
jgi:transcriptional regulator GlxA family with amidase domain